LLTSEVALEIHPDGCLLNLEQPFWGDLLIVYSSANAGIQRLNPHPKADMVPLRLVSWARCCGDQTKCDEVGISNYHPSNRKFSQQECDDRTKGKHK